MAVDWIHWTVATSPSGFICRDAIIIGRLRYKFALDPSGQLVASLNSCSDRLMAKTKGQTLRVQLYEPLPTRS